MSFAQRLVVGTVVILILAVLILLSGAERTLRRDLEGDIARSLEREALLIREALPADSAGWDEAVHRLSAQNGHRITLKRLALEGKFLKVYIQSNRDLELGTNGSPRRGD